MACYCPNTPLVTGTTLLFDLDAGPCEFHDVSSAHPDVASELFAKLQACNATAVVQQHYQADPACNPANAGDVWTPWMGSSDPSACAPPARVPLIGEVTVPPALVFPSSCGLQGWVCGRLPGPAIRLPAWQATVDEIAGGSGSRRLDCWLPRTKTSKCCHKSRLSKAL